MLLKYHLFVWFGHFKDETDYDFTNHIDLSIFINRPKNRQLGHTYFYDIIIDGYYSAHMIMNHEVGRIK